MRIKSDKNIVTITEKDKSLEMFPSLGSISLAYVGSNSLDLLKDSNLYRIFDISFLNREKIYSADDKSYIEIIKKRKTIRIKFVQNNNGYFVSRFKNNKIVDVYNRLIDYAKMESLTSYLKAINASDAFYQNINK